mmetsp:Transcript_16477/g.49195  ORF Transcript_16477/g.49195 Transcript_16477/m.49195 type:complete len:490 (+) Transcript_16477:194-1663(+)
MSQAPARKRAKRAAKPKAKQETPLEVLVARCSRKALEALAVKLASRADIEDAIADTAPPPPPVIEMGEDRRGTGAFDAVDGECFARVLHHLPATTKLRLATSVCKSWLRLRAQPGLFTSFYGNRVPSVLDTHNRGNHRRLAWAPLAGAFRGWERKHPASLTNYNLSSALNWFINKDVVLELGLDTHHAMAALISPEGVIEVLQSFPRLKSLALDGKHILSKVFKSRPECLSSLETLVLGSCVPAAGKRAFAGFVGACGNLETLCCDAGLATYEALELAVEAWRATRDGGAPLLTNLRLYSWVRDELRSTAMLGTWFPNLENVSLSQSAHCWERMDPEGMPSISTMPRLRELRLDSMAGYDTHFTSVLFERLMSAALRAIGPNVERLTVLHGICYIGGNSRRAVPPLPRVGTSLANLPATLTELVLSDVDLRAGDLAINSLKTLRVHNVGISVEDLAASLPGVDVAELYEPEPDSSESEPESDESDDMSD